ncbi:hypothetical protein LXL04_010686 [Taraxacum kok-saghyz]
MSTGPGSLIGREHKLYLEGLFTYEGYRRSLKVSVVPISFFITNFPKSILSNDIWRVSSHMGHVVDVYISPHLSRMGKRFGFVRFVEVRDEQVVLQQLNDTWFGFYKLFASTPRFSKGNYNQKSTMHVKTKTQIPTVKSKVERRHVGGNSYASIVRGGADSKQQPSMHVEDVIDLPSGDFVVIEKKRACFGRARDFLTLPNLRLLCMDEGFDELRGGGGLWVLFEFATDQMCSNFLQNDSIDHWVKERKPWDRNFVPSERLVWVDIEVLPFCAWSKGAFKKIVAQWGTVIHLDDDLGRMYTKTECIISDTLKVKVDGNLFVIRVVEASGWTPTFVKGEMWRMRRLLWMNKMTRGMVQINEDDMEKSEDPFGIY